MTTRSHSTKSANSTPNPQSTWHAEAPRREWITILLLTLVGAGWRLVGFGQLGLTHFDEGVYAISGLWSVLPGGLSGLDPQVVAYAPAGFPILIGAAYLVFGVVDGAAILVSVICGVLTIPAAGWVGRRTFGTGAGGAASALAALSSAHIAFSRKALTDSPFLLAWLVAIGLGGRFLERPRIGRAVAFGLAVGLAQNVKYNGWIIGGVIVLAALLGLVIDPDSRKRGAIARTFGLGATAALIAALVYLPWYVFVERHGGYADLIRHHRGYVGGVSTWLPHWKQQLAQVVALSGGVGWNLETWAVAWGSAGVAVLGREVFRRRSGRGIRPVFGFLVGLGAVGLALDAAWWVGLAWVGWLLIDPRPARRVLGAWWLILSVMTPFYHPYARLWLPIEAAGWLIMADLVIRLGSFASEVVRDELGVTVSPDRRALTRAAVAAACILVARIHWGGEPPRPLPSEVYRRPTDGFRVAAANLLKSTRVPPLNSYTLRVLARRPLLFYLAMDGLNRVRLLPDEKGLLEGPGSSGDWAIVDGALFSKMPDMLSSDTVPYWAHPRDGLTESEGEEAEAIKRHWKPVEVFGRQGVRLDPVTLLDVRPDAAYPRFDLDESVDLLILLAPRGADVKWFPN